MKKSKLLVLSLLAIGAIGLTSCGQGPQGEKGETGAPGEKGETGAPGKDGTDGENGKNVLNGEGAPKDTEGVDGDSYIDYSSFDYYVKESGKWVKKGNLKGAKGDTGATGEKGETGAKGEKGETGSTGGTGSRGPQGETAWSSTILPTVGGYVTVNQGSATTSEYVTFKVYPDENNYVTKFDLGDTSYLTDLLSNKVEDHYEFTIKMQANGFVVDADFKEPSDDDNYYDTDNGVFYKTLDAALEVTREDDVANLILCNEDTISETEVLNNKGTINLYLNDATLNINEKMYLINTSLTFEGNGKIVSKEDNALFGLYGGFKYSKTSTKAVETKLEIGENIKTESKCENVASIYSTDNGLKQYALTDNGDAVATDKLTFNFKGKDTSSRYGIVYVDEDVEKSDEIPVINIENASTTGSNWIAGYAELNVTNSEFNVFPTGSAFTINAGKVKFENNEFVNDHAKALAPDYAFDGGFGTTFDGNAMIWMTDNLGTFAGYTTAKSIDSAEFKNNTFSYGEGNTRPEGYYNVGLYCGNGKSTCVTPSVVDANGSAIDLTNAGYNFMKYSDFKAKVDFEYIDSEGYHAHFYCYFKDAEKAKTYTKAQFIADYGIDETADGITILEGVVTAC